MNQFVDLPLAQQETRVELGPFLNERIEDHDVRGASQLG